MIVKKVTTSDYHQIVRENKVFLWHFLQKDQCNSGCLSFFSYFDKPKKTDKHQIKEIIDTTKIPYYESLTEESVDFLISNGIPNNSIWGDKIFEPIILGFKNGIVIGHTGNRCYCVESLLEIISELDPSYLINAQ